MYFGSRDDRLLLPKHTRFDLSRVKSIATSSDISGHILTGSMMRKLASNKQFDARANNWLDDLLFEFRDGSLYKINTVPVEKSVATAVGTSVRITYCRQSMNRPVSIGLSPNLMMDAKLGVLNQSW